MVSLPAQVIHTQHVAVLSDDLEVSHKGSSPRGLLQKKEQRGIYQNKIKEITIHMNPLSFRQEAPLTIFIHK